MISSPSPKPTRYPEYEPDAVFRCSQGCGKFRRDRCGVFRGSIHCPVCRYRWTLTYVPSPNPEDKP